MKIFTAILISASLLFAADAATEPTATESFDSLEVNNLNNENSPELIDHAGAAEPTEIIEPERSFQEALLQNVDKETISNQN